MKDLHELPRFSDGLSYLYVEHCRIDQEEKAIALHDIDGKVPVPCAALSLLMLGPGTSITHAAIRALADNGCMVIWCGEEGCRFYAQGSGETRSAARFLRQARLWADAGTRMKVVERMYRMRFPGELDSGLTLQQLRGLEGIRMRDAYAKASKETGVPWEGRQYERGNWGHASPVNRALSAANACLYGICHAAIVSAGYSPALGFIHTGKQLSFVYDIADLYKVEFSIPVSFQTAAAQTDGIEGMVRRRCRDLFKERKLLERIIPDIANALGSEGALCEDEEELDSDLEPPGGIWDPEKGTVAGGVNYSETPQGS